MFKLVCGLFQFRSCVHLCTIDKMRPQKVVVDSMILVFNSKIFQSSLEFYGLSLVHNMMLVPVLHQNHQNNAGIKFILYSSITSIVVAVSNQSCCQILGPPRISFDQENRDFSCDAHNAHNTRDAHSIICKLNFILILLNNQSIKLILGK